MKLLILSALLFGQLPDAPKQKIEYLLSPLCVDYITVNREKWHCEVDNPSKPTSVDCTPGSVDIHPKKGIKYKDCVETHVVKEKKDGPDSSSSPAGK